MDNNSNWLVALRAARSEVEIVTLVQRYASSISPAVLDLLPRDCRVTHIDSADHVVELTVSIVQSEWVTPATSPVTAIVKDMARTFVLAHDRIREIRGRTTYPKK